ncbi:MAG: exodeoxyribonuclease VII small subunit [Actinomycetota bacterium]|nr:exodeoxyribonuclease VII small subunit [Actinomycetota bacterium]
MASNNESDAKEVSFEEALERIEAIIKRIQSGKSLDSLVEDVKEAKVLIALCERKISWTESELAKMLGDHAAEEEDA